MGATYIVGLGTVPAYEGEFPSPLPVMWYVPANLKEVFKVRFTAAEIRAWVKQAAAYHDVPQELAAAILQQENSPHASKVRQLLQFGERSIQTFSAIVDRFAFDVVPDKIAGGSAGVANLSRNALQGAAGYIEKTYHRPVMPDEVRYRILGWDQDTRIQGDDLRGDLYYLTAHLRQLIDQVKGKKYQGPLTLADVERIAAAYNGRGEAARKYGRDTVARLRKAVAGTEPLYFYQ